MTDDIEREKFIAFNMEETRGTREQAERSWQLGLPTARAWKAAVAESNNLREEFNACWSRNQPQTAGAVGDVLRQMWAWAIDPMWDDHAEVPKNHLERWHNVISQETRTAAPQQREKLLAFGEFIAKGSFNKVAAGRGWKDATMEQRLAAFNESRKS